MEELQTWRERRRYVLCCKEHSTMGDSTIRDKVKAGEMEVEGSCMTLHPHVGNFYPSEEEQSKCREKCLREEANEGKMNRPKKAKVESDKKRYTPGAYDTASFNPTNTAGNLRPKSRRHLKNNESKELCGRDIITYLAEKGGIKGSVNVSNGGKSQRSVQKVRSTARAAAVGLQKNWHCSICGKDPCDCSGMVLTISQIDSFIHAEAGKRKKKKIGLDDSETEIQEEVENDQNPADGIDDEE